ncbi:hypothetical protein NJ7G_0108 [Natrinema sp. J7-2]|nr:hypothetical protein NJ7G_0108 [Natrinema sp. J7-2]
MARFWSSHISAGGGSTDSGSIIIRNYEGMWHGEQAQVHG